MLCGCGNATPLLCQVQAVESRCGPRNTIFCLLCFLCAALVRDRRAPCGPGTASGPVRCATHLSTTEVPSTSLGIRRCSCVSLPCLPFACNDVAPMNGDCAQIARWGRADWWLAVPTQSLHCPVAASAVGHTSPGGLDLAPVNVSRYYSVHSLRIYVFLRICVSEACKIHSRMRTMGRCCRVLLCSLPSSQSIRVCMPGCPLLPSAVPGSLCYIHVCLALREMCDSWF